jgi:NAD(P)-dependent dehydrogenase (short-subunit alcohol dehydrogenase family)
MSRFDGKVAVVTGAANGIGQAIARGFIAEGGSVVALDRDSASLESLADSFAGRLTFVAGDVTRSEDIGAMTSRAIEDFGRIDAGFNVAGWARVAPIVDVAEKEWDRTIDVCLKGVFLSMQAEARLMIDSGLGGAIVNIASMNSEVPMRGGSPYCAAKAGVAMLSQCGAIELAEHSIRVNTVSPGLVDTRMTQFVLSDPTRTRLLLDRIPADRPASADEIASVALFLASDEASYVNGANLFADGAWRHTAYPDMRALPA